MSTRTSSTSSEMPHLNAGFDPDIDKYLDLDQNTANSSTSPDTRPESSAHNSAASSLGNSQSQQTFSGPSFQYESYKQQTGLPVGALANTFALNQATGMQYNEYGNGFIMPMETLNVPLTNLDEFDFAAYPSMEMDLEPDSPTDNVFYPSAKAGFVDPNAIFGREDASTSSSAPVQRMYPGIHSELAAQAKAQQAHKQNGGDQQPRQLPQGQRPLPQNSKNQPAKDPHVEESISRLLNQMRQSSVASVDDEAATPTANLPHLARLRKDEDEMDEDERLLASEEGKKLSSKERRQLRNKVSARAFRSRRKEYIGQLEGEVAVKAQEANDLKVQNRQLMEENTRLTDLTRMLLSSQAFSGFLSELSGTALPSSSSLAQTQSQTQPQPTRKDVNPHQAARQLRNQQQRIGMATIPEGSVDFPTVDAATSASSWSTGVGLNNFSVYSVTSVPEGPALDVETLSGKISEELPFQTPEAVKPDMPNIQRRPSFIETEEATPPFLPMHDRCSGLLDKATFPLYAEPSSTSPIETHSAPTVPRVADSKTATSANRELVSNIPNAEANAASRFALMCSRLDAVSARIAAVTSHLN